MDPYSNTTGEIPFQLESIKADPLQCSTKRTFGRVKSNIVCIKSRTIMHSLTASAALLLIFIWRPARGNDVWGPASSRTCRYTFNVDREDGCGVTNGAVSQLQTTVNELHSQVSSLLEQNTNLLEQNTNLLNHNMGLLEDNAYWRQVTEKKLGDLEDAHAAGGAGGVGATYTRWGRTVCPANSSLVHTGYAASSHFTHTGGSSELICLPEQPQWGRHVDGFQGESHIYGTEYETRYKYGANDVFLKDNIDGQSLHNHNVPCAVCYTDGRSSAVRFPAMLQCPDGWSEEYHGYLMACHHAHKGKMQPVCLDEAPEAAESGLADENGALFFNVEATCGSLPCPNYINGRELTCVVCSR